MNVYTVRYALTNAKDCTYKGNPIKTVETRKEAVAFQDDLYATKGIETYITNEVA